MLSVGPSFVSQFQRKNEDLIQRADDFRSDLAGISSLEQAKFGSMPRSLSLKNRERIRILFRSAKRRSGRTLTVFYRICINSGAEEVSENSPAKWLVAIPKRTGNAVKRNKIRRALRETIRLWPNRAQVEGEVIVRFNAPFKKKQKNSGKQKQVVIGQVTNKNSVDKESLHGFQLELLGLLEEMYSSVAKNK